MLNFIFNWARPTTNSFFTRTCGPRYIVMASEGCEEKFDVLRPDGTQAGFSKPRSLVHRDGDLHRSTHVWILGDRSRVLLQKRSATKDTFPGRWDVSAAGHIAAGDESRSSALRELQEELGIKDIDPESLRFAFTTRASALGFTDRHGPFIDNELQDVYIYGSEREISPEEFKLQTEEVEMVQYWDWKEYKGALESGDTQFVPRSKEYINQFDLWLQRESNDVNV